MNSERFDRQVAWFGELGQSRIRDSHIAVIGIGGLGTHIVQQLSLLGVGSLTLIDDEEVSETNRNRYIGVRFTDPVPGFRKTDLGERIANEIDPSISIHKVFDSLVSVDGFAAVRSADFVFGCIDSEGARFILNELCATYGRPYLDLASDIIPGEHVEYGGRVCVSINGGGCIQCFGILDTKEAGEDLAGESERRNRAAVYGVQREFLGRSGPSVVSINGVIASLAITEFIATITGIREPQRLLTYKGTSGKVFAGITQSSQECFICNGLRGTGQTSDVERYIRNGTRERLRRSSGTNASVLQTKEQISSMNAAAASSPENETTLVLRETIQQQ